MMLCRRLLDRFHNLNILYFNWPQPFIEWHKTDHIIDRFHNLNIS